ncbi:MAG: HAD family phosphatase [Salibacteraceae bacterium]
MLKSFNSIDAIILDLGGVILNIDYDLTIKAFKELGFRNFEEQYSQLQQSGLFDRLETGMISPDDFVSEIKRVLPKATNKEIIEAWNALLLDFPEGRIHTVIQIAEKRPTFLLSNTNAIHYKEFNKTFYRQTGLKDIKPLFKEAFLSHEIHLRKPDIRAFELILDKHELKAGRTFFVDDSPQHVEAAKRMGIQSYLMNKNDSLEQLLAPILA